MLSEGRLVNLGNAMGHSSCTMSRRAGPEAFDGVVLGDSIHAGRHSRALTRYLEEHRGPLASRPTALFQVSLTSANPDAEHTATAQKLIHDLIERTGCDPDLVGLFAGALVYRIRLDEAADHEVDRSEGRRRHRSHP